MSTHSGELGKITLGERGTPEHSSPNYLHALMRLTVGIVGARTAALRLVSSLAPAN
jgi:hypothetical protein